MKESYNLSCGRNKVKHNNPSIKLSLHKSHINKSMLNLCIMHSSVYCSNATIFIGILTRPELIYERMIIRKILYKLKDIKYCFITGNTTNENIYKLIKEEFFIYHDIILFKVISSYYNCSLIMVCYYQYLYNNCRNIIWFMKLDIDTYFNISFIKSIISNISDSIAVIGAIHKHPKIPCYNNAKWSIDCKIKNATYINYSPYPHGPGFLFKSKSIKCVNDFIKYEESFIWIEDAMFGDIIKFCELKLLDIKENTDMTYKEKKELYSLRNKVFIHGLYPIEILILSTNYQKIKP